MFEMMPPLADASQVEGLPGGPWTAMQIRSGGDSVRRIAGWHIAPRLTQTIVLDHDGSSRLILPSLYVRSVELIRNLLSATPTAISGWRFSRNGVVAGRFPAGIGAIEVTFEHGYELCPTGLLPLVAEASTRARLRSRTAGPFSESYDLSASSSMMAPDDILSSYTLARRP